MKPICFLFATVLLTIAPGGVNAQRPLDDALSRIRHNVEVFENQLPDFVCQEKITSRTIAESSGFVEKETVVESVFTGKQKRSTLSKLTSTSFTEERRIDLVNGVRWEEKSLPKGVFRVGGAYSSTLVSIFGAKGQENYSYSEESSDSETAFLIAFSSKNHKSKIRSKEGVRSFQQTGRAWFDPDSFEITRLERRIVADGGLPGDELPIVIIEYQPVRIGADTFRLPARVTSVAHRAVAGKVERGEYEALYSGYRKYASSSTIQYPDLGK